MTRQKLVTVRLSAAQYARLVAAAEAASTSSSALIRDLVFGSLGTGSSVPVSLPTAPVGALARTVSCRLTAAEAERLDEQARDCDIPVAAYVRLVLRGHMPRAGRPVAHAAVVSLSRLGNNLNQLTRLAHGGTLLSRDLFNAIEVLRAEIHRLREEILGASEDRP
jgi:predicted DNA-binding protein